MFGGIILILTGVLIALFPALLSILVAMLLIALGGIVISIAYYDRKLRYRHDNPVMAWFFRF